MNLSNRWEKYKRIVGLYLSLLFLVIISIAMYVYEPFISKILLSPFSLLGLFLISFTSCLSIVPIPYVVMVFQMAQHVNPILTSIVVGTGSALGEAITWFFGRASYNILEGTIYAKRINALLRFMELKGSLTIPFLTFLFSLTFLPDKVIYLPLGIMKYSIWKVLPFTILGKSIMIYLVLLLGRLWSDILNYESNFTSFAITVVFLSIILMVMTFVDWEKVLFGEKSG
ncbi:MAG: hypothetical protein QXV06_01600 [Ignisphaera sp.]